MFQSMLENKQVSNKTASPNFIERESVKQNEKTEEFVPNEITSKNN